MYWEQTAVVRTEHGITEEFQVKKGIRLGCVYHQVYLICTQKKYSEK